MRIAEGVAKLVNTISTRLLHRSGETWPGEIARYFLRDPKKIASLFREVIYVVGTNGKTSTTKMLVQILRENGYDALTNASGANMLNGVLSSILVQKKFKKNDGYIGVFEVDEFALRSVTEILAPTHILFLNVVRDQLDRYGEVRNVLGLWRKILDTNPECSIIANAYDPGLSWVCESVSKNAIHWYGIPEQFLKNDSAVLGDSSYCFFCNHKLKYDGTYVSHLGKWNCPACKKKSEQGFVWHTKDLHSLGALPDYMSINMQGIFLLTQLLNIPRKQFFSAVSSWKPAYGRGEVRTSGSASITFALGKNPASWTVALRDSLKKKKYSTLVLGLNNQIPDGRDVSWIWDADIDRENLSHISQVWTFGDRAHDMAVRLHMEGIEVEKVYTNAKQCFADVKKKSEDILILSNYTAMLDSRRALLGKAIL